MVGVETLPRRMSGLPAIRLLFPGPVVSASGPVVGTGSGGVVGQMFMVGWPEAGGQPDWAWLE